MKIVIFAGGAGTRLWPLSRKKTPKQFDPMFRGQSTLQLAVDRVKSMVDWADLYISTLDQYASLVRQQLPDVPDENIITEPTRRDVGPAIGLAMLRLRDVGDEPLAILWSDHLMGRPAKFRKGLRVAESLIKKDPERFIFFGERPRYAEQNLGWIQVGRVLERRLDIPIRCFRGWHYRPPLRVCQRMFVSKKWIWNPGYWVTTPNFVLAQFQRHQPKMYQQLLLIGRSLGTSCEGRVLQRVYPRLPKIHFDNAVLEKIKPSQAVVLQLDMGWSDPGTLYAIKEALQSRVGANVTRGAVVDFGSSDCLLFNDAPEKLLATVGLHGMIVVAVGDAILVVHKDHVPEVKKMVESLEGTEWSHLL